MAISVDETCSPSTAVGSHTFTPPSSPWTSGASYTANAQGVQRQNLNGPSTDTSLVTVTITKDETVVAYQGVISRPIVNPSYGFNFNVANITTSAGLLVNRVVLHRLSADASTSLDVIYDATIDTDTTAWGGTISVNFGSTIPYTGLNPDDVYGIEMLWTNTGHGDLSHQFRITSIDFGGRAPSGSTSGIRHNGYDDVAIVDESGTVLASYVYDGSATNTFPVNLKSNTQYYLRMTNIGDTPTNANSMNPDYGINFNYTYHCRYKINSDSWKYYGWGDSSAIYCSDPAGRFYHHDHYFNGGDLEYRTGSNIQGDGRCTAAIHENGEGVIFFYYMDSSTSPRCSTSYFSNYGENVVTQSPRLVNLTSRTYVWDHQGAYSATTYDGWAVSPFHVNNTGTYQIWWCAREVKEVSPAYVTYTWVENLSNSLGRIIGCFRTSETSSSITYVYYNDGTGIIYRTITPSTSTVSSPTTINSDRPVQYYSIKGANDDYHIIYQEYTSDDVKHLHWDGSSWTTYTITSASSTRYNNPIFDGTTLRVILSRDSADVDKCDYEPVYKFSGSSWSKESEFSCDSYLQPSQQRSFVHWNGVTMAFDGINPTGTLGSITVYMYNPDPLNYGPGVRRQGVQSHIAPGDTGSTYRWWGLKGVDVSRNGDLMVAMTANYTVQDYRQLWFWKAGGNVDADIPSPKLVTSGNEFDNPYITNDYWPVFNPFKTRDSGSYNTQKELEIEFPFWIDGDKISNGDSISFELYTTADAPNDDGLSQTTPVYVYRIGSVSITGVGDADVIGDIWQGRVTFNAGGAVTQFLEAKYLDSDEFEESNGPILDTTTSDESRSWIFLNGDDFMGVLDSRVEYLEGTVLNSSFSMTGSVTTKFFGDFG